MRSSIAVSEIRFAPANTALRSKGLIGWVCCSYGDLQLDGLRVLRTGDGRHSLGFPTRTDERGIRHPYYRPLDQESRDAIEAAVLGELRRRGLIPGSSPSPHSRTYRTSRERGGAS